MKALLGNELWYEDEVYLKSAELKVGHYYLSQLGVVLLYLGAEVRGYSVFYECFYVRFKETYINGKLYVSLKNYSMTMRAISSFCEELKSNQVLIDSLYLTRTSAKILSEVTHVKPFTDFGTWYVRSSLLYGTKGLPKLKSLLNTKETGYATPESLITGKIYYNKSYNWLYLGRASDGKFIWRAIPYMGILNKFTDVKRLIEHAEATKSIRKVKPITMIAHDISIQATKEELLMASKDITFDVSVITQEMLDWVSAKC